MTTLQVKTRTNSIQRAAFTLVELMIVIVIIGILAAIATPVIFAAMRSAQELTIINEVQQMNAAVERFKTEHGFYPPTIGPDLEIDTTSSTGLSKFRRYLNRIAPNNAEVSSGGLENWWREVGVNLDDRTSLVFWLSGLCTSKQYPLSGSAALVAAGTPPAAYNANFLFDGSDAVDGSGNPINIDRNAFFDFKLGQLVGLVRVNPSDPPFPRGVKAYTQPEGAGGLLAYRYRDFKSYDLASPAYHLQDPPGSGPVNFFNPTTFQIVCPGLDGELVDPDAASPSTNLFDPIDPFQDDNITNFSNGRLEKSFE